MDTTTATMVETLRKLTVDVREAGVTGSVRTFVITNETDARHAGKVLRACRLPRVKVLAPLTAGGMWTVTMGTQRD